MTKAVNKKPIHLFPANGLDPMAYTPLINKLASDFQVLPHRYQPNLSPHMPIPTPLSWQLFSDAIDKDKTYQDQEDLIGMGHSLGGTVLLYNALKQPKRWDKIIIMDPALFSSNIKHLYSVIQSLKLERYLHPMLRLTRKRRALFASEAEIFERWRPRKQFQFLSDEALQYFIQASVMPDPNNSQQFVLRFPKAWEYAIYESMCSLDPYIWQHLPQLKSKLIVLAGQSSTTFLSGARQKIKPYCHRFVTLDNTTHLLPFEDINAVAKIIKEN